ncbi:MAG: uridine kinase [Myxococcota bacterium]|nr:uridine kinase [Myxococcota bacterium]
MPHLIGIAGGTASGKSTLARRIARALTETRCATVSQDNYYRDLSSLSVEARAAVNFDHPESIDAELFAEHLRELRAGRSVTAPRYDFAHHTRGSGGEVIEARPVILVEGILVFVFPEVAEQLDVKIYVQTPDDIRLARRVQRDIAERGRDVDGVLRQYLHTVRPMHENYGHDSRRRADLIVPGSGDNQTVVRMLARALGADVPLV